MSSIDLEDDLLIFTMDLLENDDCHSHVTSDLSTSDYQSIDIAPIADLSSIEPNTKRMYDITDLLDSSELNNKEENPESISTSVGDYLRTHNLQNDQDNYGKNQWEMEEDHLKYGSKQLSPSDYLTRKSLYNRPVAFEKDSRLWARSLLDDLKKSNKSKSSSSSSINFAYYFPVIKNSSSFDHHVQYIEHLNECNDYPAYLEYLRENRSQLFYTLTDSIDMIDGLIGTVVS